MSRGRDDIEARTEILLEAGYLDSNPPELQALCIAVYRLLLKGAPVSDSDIARATGFGAARIAELFELIPDCACERNDTNDANDANGITAFIGLSITPAKHRLVMGDGTFHTWCAFDALFLPPLLGKEAEIITRCPASDEEIRVRLSPDALLSVEPGAAVMSLVAPDQDAYRRDLRGSFCCNVNFFRDREVFEAWKQEDREIEAISLQDAFALAQRRNAYRFPDIDLATGAGNSAPAAGKQKAPERPAWVRAGAAACDLRSAVCGRSAAKEVQV